MKQIKKFKLHYLTAIIVLALLAVPVVSSAQGLVPCNGIDCDFNAFMDLINRVIEFILFNLALPIAAVMFAYAGFLLITAGGEAASARTKAKSIFTNAVVGLVIAAAAWLIIRTVLAVLGYNGDWIGF